MPAGVLLEPLGMTAAAIRAEVFIITWGTTVQSRPWFGPVGLARWLAGRTGRGFAAGGLHRQLDMWPRGTYLWVSLPSRFQVLRARLGLPYREVSRYFWAPLCCVSCLYLPPKNLVVPIQGSPIRICIGRLFIAGYLLRRSVTEPSLDFLPGGSARLHRSGTQFHFKASGP